LDTAVLSEGASDASEEEGEVLVSLGKNRFIIAKSIKTNGIAHAIPTPTADETPVPRSATSPSPPLALSLKKRNESITFTFNNNPNAVIADPFIAPSVTNKDKNKLF
jgi:hypothetical protein